MAMTEADKRAEQILDLARVMESDFGRRVVWRVIRKCGLYDSVTREVGERNLPFSERVIYNAGQQDLAQWLIRELQVASPKLVRLMHEEAEGRFLGGKQNA